MKIQIIPNPTAIDLFCDVKQIHGSKFHFQEIDFFLQFSPKQKYNKNKAIQLLGLKQLVEKKNIGKNKHFQSPGIAKVWTYAKIVLVDLKKCFRDPQAMAKRDNWEKENKCTLWDGPLGYTWKHDQIGVKDDGDDCDDGALCYVASLHFGMLMYTESYYLARHHLSTWWLFSQWCSIWSDGYDDDDDVDDDKSYKSIVEKSELFSHSKNRYFGAQFF